MRYIRHISILVLLLTCCTSSFAADSIRVAAIYAKTSKVASGAALQLEGIRHAVDEINDSGGLLGKHLELLEFDNKGTPIGANAAAKEAVKAGVVTVFGSNYSSHSLGMAPVLQEAHIPMISNISTNPQVTLVGNYIFRVCYTDPFQGKVLANFAVRDLHAMTAGLLVNVDDQYSEGLAQFFIENYEKQGGKILFVENYLEKRSDFSSFFDKVKQYQPEILFHPGHTKVSAFVLKQAQANGIDTTFLGGDGWNDSMYDIAGNAIEGNYYSNHWHPNSTGKRSRKFVERFSSHSWEYDPGAALAYDCVFLFADAVKRAKSFEPSLIRDAIAATNDYDGVTGRITLDSNGDPIKSAVILKFENGTSTYVKTVEP